MASAYLLIAKIAANALVAAVLSRLILRASALDKLRRMQTGTSPLLAKFLSCSSCQCFWLALLGGVILVGPALLVLAPTVLLGWRGAYHLSYLADRLPGFRPARPLRECHVCGSPYAEGRFIHRQGLDFCSHHCWFNHLKTILRPKPVIFDRQGMFIRQEVCAMSFSEFSPAQAQELLQGNTGYVYVDVRSTPEYEQGHPAGAFNVPIFHRQATGMTPNRDFLEVMERSFPPDTKLLLGCQSGIRSVRAAEALAAAGYSILANVRGGYGGVRDQLGRVVEKGWAELGLPIEQGSPEDRGYAALALKR